MALAITDLGGCKRKWERETQVEGKGASAPGYFTVLYQRGEARFTRPEGGAIPN
jgi:hypothetical protein